MELSSKPQLLERETVFVPAGWDTQAKIQADFDNQRLTKDAEEPFAKVIAVPPALQLARQTDKMIVASAEEDHVFLQRLHQQIQSDPALASSGANPESQQMFLDSLKRMGVVGGSSPSQHVSAPSLVTTPAPAAVAPLVAPIPTQASSPSLQTGANSAAASIVKPTSPAIPSASSASDLLASLSSSIAAAGSPARVGRQASSSVSSTAEHQALHSFFNSLLGGSGSAGASREAAAKVLNNNPK
jgi:dynein light intermediate chain 1, cytosolic